MVKSNGRKTFRKIITSDELISQIGYKPDGLWDAQSSSMCGYFQGHKVFCDNTLKFGEVEIR